MRNQNPRTMIPLVTVLLVIGLFLAYAMATSQGNDDRQSTLPPSSPSLADKEAILLKQSEESQQSEGADAATPGEKLDILKSLEGGNNTSKQ